ncbi:13738_t:CDS:1 [Ambispora leptoticha]|uniref:13738_t:CDS:1 n=1 Tax=Ambispora leptoticha TaxID=144679 RepID=A0A9N9FHL5_9GLOM|nr:13738_t:CDS:1 [Ambispora leptoticha]
MLLRKLVNLAIHLFIIVFICIIISILYYNKESFSRYINGSSTNLLDEYNLTSTNQQRLKPNRKCNHSFDTNANENNEEKFITYLPHSGFHNQRISLENAIFIAWYTNRTLIVPPVILGTPIFWSPNTSFAIRLARLNATKNFDDCHSFLANKKQYNRCIREYQSYTLFPWDELIDLSSIRNHVSIINRQDFNSQDLYKLINITDPEKEVYYPEEKSRYDIQLYDQEDALNQEPNVPKFERQLPICNLLNRKEKLVHFYSIFSSNRIKISLNENQIFREMIQRKLVFGHPILINVTKEITRKLGGSEKYIGLHLRVSDGGFEIYKMETAQYMIQAIKNEEGVNQETVNENNDSNDGDDNVIDESRCANNSQYHFNKKIFLATDGQPKDPAVQQIFTTFPCTVTINDFSTELQLLTNLKNERDKSSLYKYFLPMVDLIVSARGSEFFGTYGSTFSAYALRLHQIWVPDGTGKIMDIRHQNS